MKTETIVTLVSVAIGLAGFLYGLFKDKEIKNIIRRGAVPNFKIIEFTLNLMSFVEHQDGTKEFEFSKHIPSLETPLSSYAGVPQPFLPWNIPKGQNICCSFQNMGKEKNKYFSFKSIRKVHIGWDDEDKIYSFSIIITTMRKKLFLSI